MESLYGRRRGDQDEEPLRVRSRKRIGADLGRVRATRYGFKEVGTRAFHRSIIGVCVCLLSSQQAKEILKKPRNPECAFWWIQCASIVRNTVWIEASAGFTFSDKLRTHTEKVCTGICHRFRQLISPPVSALIATSRFPLASLVEAEY